MRHFLANIAIYLIALFLFSAAALFGWVRSAQLVVTHEPVILAQFAPRPAYDFEWSELGERAYRRNCENCHGPEGRGWDEYPGLSHTAMLFLAGGGRDYVVDLHLYGLTSRRWGAPMPPMGHLHDIELAAVINHVLTHFGNEQVLDDNAALYEPRDIGQRRGLDLSPRAVEARRPEVVTAQGGGQE
jgi:mono/diheme cytochrome c family protein